jgi:hypothetical protein
MCGPRSYRTYRRLATVPADPSPTPWDFNTWGFFCDACMTFFDLLQDGKVILHGDATCHHEHKCGQAARYIGYCRDGKVLLA